MLRIAIASDIHAYATTNTAAGFVSALSDAQGEHRNALKALIGRAKKGDLKSDYLLCPGDLGDKADVEGISYCWKNLHKLAAELGGAQLIASTGNHDVDSRHQKNKYDPDGFLRQLEPAYPTSDLDLNDKYWSRHFFIIEGASHRLLTLNSSAFHPYVPEESEHGRISEWTLEAIRSQLSKCSRKPINILLCHHHPHVHDEYDLGETDIMKSGGSLLRQLAKSTCGPWMVIHGHKHHPKLSRAQGSLSAPIVLSAGSIGANIYPVLATHVRNQFHMVELDDTCEELDTVRGRFRTWDWAAGDGWEPAAKRSGLPAVGGFGFVGNLRDLSERAISILQKSPSQSENFGSLSDKLPDLCYLSPDDLGVFCEKLSQRNIVVRYNIYGHPEQIAIQL